jgi:hypothetical protein
MTVGYGSRTLGDLIDQAEDGLILLPNFQRSFVWPVDAQAALAASVLLNVPCGSMLLVKGKTDDFSSRLVGRLRPQSEVEVGVPCEYLLDGQQRIGTVRTLFADPFAAGNWKDVFEKSSTQLRARWSLRVRPDDSDDPDLFGWRDLRLRELPPEVELIKDILVRHIIYKTKRLDSWFHPAFEANVSQAKRELSVGRAGSKEGLVPLWGLLTAESQNSGLWFALSDIGEDRRQDLVVSLQDQNDASREALEDLLGEGEKWDQLDITQLEERLRDRRAEWVQSVWSMLIGLRARQFSTIELTKEELPKAIVIFEAINRGGSPLTPFDLVSARYARGQKQKSLPEMIQSSVEAYPTSLPKGLVPGGSQANWSSGDRVCLVNQNLTTAFKNQFLQTLVMHKLAEEKGISYRFSVEDTKQQSVLALSSEDIDAGWEDACLAVLRAWQFLQLRCGIKDEGALRNKLLVLPLAMALSDDKHIKRGDKTYDRLEYWYWSSVLSGVYLSRQNENCVSDTNSLLSWLRSPGEPNPFLSREDGVLDTEGYSDKECLLRLSDEEVVGADVGEYLLQLVLALGGQDLVLKRRLNVVSDRLHDHHLIPLGTAATVGQSSSAIRKGTKGLAALLNSPLNRTYVVDSTNLAIGMKPIAQYMNDIKPAVKASQFLNVEDDFLQKSGEDYEKYVRGVLEKRFEQIKGSVINKLTQLKQ